MNKTIKLFSLALIAAVVSMLSLPAVVSADGNENDTVTRTVCTTAYGGATECHDEEVPTEEIVHEEVEELVDTGIVENMAVVLSLLATGAGMLIWTQRQAA